MEFSVAAPEVTVKFVDPETLPEVAEMVVLCPAVTVVAKPALLMVAAEVFEEFQLTELVKSFVLLSE